MIVRAISGVVTSRGVCHAGHIVDIPSAEAAMLVNMGRVVPIADDEPKPQNRDVDLPVVKRGRPRKT